jgi:hypothetical protein
MSQRTQQAHHDITIPAPGKSPASEKVVERDTIQWTNNSGFQITSFDLPGCVGPHINEGTIPNNGKSYIYAVQEFTSGSSYSYSYVLDDSMRKPTKPKPRREPRVKQSTQSGTIDVS